MERVWIRGEGHSRMYDDTFVLPVPPLAAFAAVAGAMENRQYESCCSGGLSEWPGQSPPPNTLQYRQSRRWPVIIRQEEQDSEEVVHLPTIPSTAHAHRVRPLAQTSFNPPLRRADPITSCYETVAFEYQDSLPRFNSFGDTQLLISANYITTPSFFTSSACCTQIPSRTKLTRKQKQQNGT